MKTHLIITLEHHRRNENGDYLPVLDHHKEALGESGRERAFEMLGQGFTEGELHDNIHMGGDPEGGVSYQGYWKAEEVNPSNPLQLVICKSEDDEGFDLAATNTNLPIDIALLEEDMCGEGDIVNIHGNDYVKWSCMPDEDLEIVGKVF